MPVFKPLANVMRTTIVSQVICLDFSLIVVSLLLFAVGQNSSHSDNAMNLSIVTMRRQHVFSLKPSKSNPKRDPFLIPGRW